MNTQINKKQLIYLFLCNFAILFAGFGLFPLLPLYAAEFGANHSMAGVYMAIVYISLGAGSIVAGKFSQHLSRKRLFILTGALGIPALILLGQATSLWQVVLLTAVVWFTGGAGLSIADVLTGLHTTKSTRGKIFGLISLTSPLGALIGGIVVGQLAQSYGYPIMFAATAIVWAMWPILAIWKIDYKPSSAALVQTRVTHKNLHRNGSFLFLLVSVLLASMAVSIGRLGLSFIMKASHFSVHDVSMANAFGGLIAIPVTLLIGAFSDKLGIKKFVSLAYLIAVCSCLLLQTGQYLWQFWLVSVLALNARSIISSMSSALATDMLNREGLERGLPLVNTMNSVASVLGFAISGYVMDLFGPVVLFSIATVIALLAVAMMMKLPGGRERIQNSARLDVAHE